MLRVLYEDNHLIAVYKPAGVLVQAGDRKSGNLMDEVKKYIKEKYKKEGNVFLGLVHRLDRPVCGIVVFAKTSKGASRLSEQFRSREVKKTYIALVEGKVSGPGDLIHFIKKDLDRLTALVQDSFATDYQRAELSYRVLKSGGKTSLLKIDLKTGRFNQIRAQLAHIGHPIVGDIKYGFKNKDLGFKNDREIALCATEITFKTATTDEPKTLSIGHPSEWFEMLR